MQQLKLLFVFTVIISLRFAAAQQDDQLNAAYWYQRAIENLESLPERDREMMLNYAPGDAPTPELRDALRNAEPVLALVKRGAAQQYSDFGLDLSQGIDLMLPHLGQLRQCTKMMVASAHVKLHDGDSLGAARELGSLYNVGEHMTDDRIVISSLVGQAIFNHSDIAVQSGVDRGAFDATASAELYKAIERFNAEDPFGYVETLFSEQELMISTLENHFGDPTKTDEMLKMLVGEGPHADAFLADLRDEGLDAQIDKVDATMNEVIEIFMIEDEDEAKRRMNEFEEAVVAGEFGSLAMLAMPAYGKIHQRMREGRVQIEARRAMLEQLARGELNPDDILNAALIYKQAIDAWYGLDPAKRAAILTVVSDSTQSIDEAIVAMLVETGPVLEMVRQASRFKRCEFSILRRDEELTIVPGYVVGMHELLAILRVDALRLGREKNSNEAADRLAIGFRTIGHLSGDDQLLTALVAHCAFDDLTLQLKSGLSAGLYDEQRDMLREAVDRINRRDPFGYVNAVTEARKQVERPLRHHSAVFTVRDNDEIDAMISDWQGDQLLYVITMLETLRERDRENRRQQQPAIDQDVEEREMYHPILIDRLRPMHGVISLEAVQAAQGGAAETAALLAEGNLDIIQGREIPSIGSWDDRMRQARGDLRDARRLVKADETDDGDENLNDDDTAGAKASPPSGR